jgi:cellulose synthase/poly-beta-1,6-N-acetylglucosamine synthase-like glycosyltransferase
LPTVSVLVAAWNEAEMIGEHIQSFLGLSYPHKELVLCAGGPDGTLLIAREQAGEGVRVLEQEPGEGKQRALRRCLEQANGEILFLTDADCLLDDEAFTRTLAPLLQGSEEAATGTSRPLVRQERSPFVVHQWCTDLYANAGQPDYVTGLLGRNCAVKRQAMLEAGGFEAEVRTGTDYYLAQRLVQKGIPIRWVRDSSVQTRYPETSLSYWRKQSRWVRNLIVHGPKFSAHREVAMALRTAAVGWVMLLLPFVASQTGPIWLALWAVLCAQALLARVRYTTFARLYRGVQVPAQQVALTPLYLWVDWIAWSLPLPDLLFRRHRW